MEPKKTVLDAIIIGGGPAGLSAALWCRDLGLKAILFEGKTELGGQLLWTHNPIGNYIGLKAANGRELRDRLVDHVDSIGASTIIDTAVSGVDLKNKVVTFNDGRGYESRGIIIATGVRRRILGVPGEAEFEGRGVLDSGVRHKDDVAGKNVVIVGGGDAAIENAVLLSEQAKSVLVIHRRKDFSARAEFLNRARSIRKIRFMPQSEVRAIGGREAVASVDVTHLDTRRKSVIEADAVLIRIGVIPNTENFKGHLKLDAKGYIIVDSSAATSEPGVFAAGDVSSPTSPTISTAVGMGATAAKALNALLNRTESM